MKLPKARKRGDTYAIALAYAGKRYYCTRDTEKECTQCAAISLLQLKAQFNDPASLKPMPPYPFRALFEKYDLEVGKNIHNYHNQLCSISLLS